MSVQHFRLINKDELIGEVIYEDIRMVILRQPLLVDEQSIGEGQKVVCLLRYILGGDDSKIKFDRSHILTQTDVFPEIERFYRNSLISNEIQKENTIDLIRQCNDAMEYNEFNRVRAQRLRDEIGDGPPKIVWHLPTETKH